MDTTSQSFFEAKYQRQRDPWNFASDVYEQGRYQQIVRALSHRHYAVAFEPGCSIGVLTEQLAAMCRKVHAIDISPSAAESARKRCGHLAHVEITSGPLSGLIPCEPLDLIVFSEIGYYLSEVQLDELAKTLMNRLTPGGVFLASHWTGNSEDHLISGDRVHEILRAVDGLVHEHSEYHPCFRLDRWRRR
jgi:predicted TPR repeat methyltransferase